MAEVKNVPLHVAIIMDGNGRWAKKRFLPRTAGHAAGSKIVENICELAFNKGVKYLTVYAFSTENWKRPDSEVKTIMNLLREYLKDCIKKSTKNNMRIRVIGERSRLDEDIQNQIKELEEASKNNTGLNFTVALNYGGRDDILRAARKAAHDYKDGKIDIDAFEEISNYMMWQLAYSEIYVTDVLWPDFNEAELDKALAYFVARDRRFGGIKTDGK